LLLLHLAKARLAEMLGKSKTDTVQASELIAATKRSGGTVAGRLSELCTESLAERKGKGEYHVTTLGLHLFQEVVLPKLKQNERGM
jgi:predicted transcriptional regulator